MDRAGKQSEGAREGGKGDTRLERLTLARGWIFNPKQCRHPYTPIIKNPTHPHLCFGVLQKPPDCFPTYLLLYSSFSASFLRALSPSFLSPSVNRSRFPSLSKSFAPLCPPHFQSNLHSLSPVLLLNSIPRFLTRCFSISHSIVLPCLSPYLPISPFPLPSSLPSYPLISLRRYRHPYSYLLNHLPSPLLFYLPSYILITLLRYRPPYSNLPTDLPSSLLLALPSYILITLIRYRPSYSYLPTDLSSPLLFSLPSYSSPIAWHVRTPRAQPKAHKSESFNHIRSYCGSLAACSSGRICRPRSNAGTD